MVLCQLSLVLLTPPQSQLGVLEFVFGINNCGIADLNLKLLRRNLLFLSLIVIGQLFVPPHILGILL